MRRDLASLSVQKQNLARQLAQASAAVGRPSPVVLPTTQQPPRQW